MLFFKPHNTRRNIAISLLVIFSAGFACDMLCDIGTNDNSHSHASHFFQTPQLSESSDLHILSDIQHQNSNEFSQGEERTDKCCNEGINKLYDGIIKKELSGFDFNKIQIFTHESSIPITWDLFHSNISTVLQNSILPSKEGRTIRILFQSFLC